MPRTTPDDTPAVAAFDLDGTLTRGRQRRALAEGRRGDRRRPARARATRDGARRWRDPRPGRPPTPPRRRSSRRCSLVVRSTTSWRCPTAFADEHLRRAVRPDVVERLEAHLGAGHVVVVVSASPALYVARIAEALGAHGAAATDLEVAPDGTLTGRYDGANCRGEEKLRKVQALLAAPRRGRAACATPLRLRQLARRPAAPRRGRPSRRRLAARPARPAPAVPPTRRGARRLGLLPVPGAPLDGDARCERERARGLPLVGDLDRRPRTPSSRRSSCRCGPTIPTLTW